MSLAQTMGNLGAPRIVLGAPKGPKANATATYTRGGALPSLKQQRAPATYGFGSGGGGGGQKKPPAVTPLNPYDAFNLAQPYDPAGIHQTATDAFNTDVAQAKTLSTMGGLTPEQIAAQAKNRADQQTALGASLAAALSGIQRASVGSGNAGATGLAATDAATTATGDRSQALAGMAPASTATADAGTRAVLAGQTASEGNMYGGLEAAALSRGSQAAQAAYAAGDTLKQTQDDAQAKTLAQLLSGVTPIAGREATMTDANSKTEAANTSTHLAIWQNLQNQELQARMSGDRKQIAQAQLDSKNYVAGLDNATRKALGITQANTRIATAKIGAQARTSAAQTSADATLGAAKIRANTQQQLAILKAKTSGANKPPTAAALLAVNKQIAKIMGSPGGITTPGAPETTGYTVTLGQREIRPGVPDIVNKGTTTPIPVDPATGAKLKVGDPMPGYPGQTIAAVAPKTRTGQKTVTDKPSTWTKWTRALGSVMTTFPQLDRTSAVQFMVKAGYPPPPSPGK